MNRWGSGNLIAQQMEKRLLSQERASTFNEERFQVFQGIRKAALHELLPLMKRDFKCFKGYEKLNV
jgi:hypothetical protein